MIALATNGSYPVGSEIQLKPPSAGHASSVLGYADFTSSDNTTLQIDNLTNITSVKITATIAKNVTTRKTKSENKMFVLKVTNTVEDLDKPKYNLDSYQHIRHSY